MWTYCFKIMGIVTEINEMKKISFKVLCENSEINSLRDNLSVLSVTMSLIW